MSTESQDTPVRIRALMDADIEFALAQTVREGWDSTANLFQALMAHDPGGSFIAELDGRRAGIVTTTCYVESGWIGNLIVPPEFRKRAIGSVLMQHAIQHLEQQEIACIRLEADPPGINIYRRLGFREEYESPRFRIEHYSFRAPSQVIALAESDLGDISGLDFRLFGDDRRRMLRLLLRTNAVAGFWIPQNGQPAGYIFVQASKEGYRRDPGSQKMQKQPAICWRRLWLHAHRSP